MDPYLRAVGFIRRNAHTGKLKEMIMASPDRRILSGTGCDETHAEYYKMFGENIGVMLRGNLTESEELSESRIEAFAVSDYDSVANRFLVEQSLGSPVIVFEDESSGNELVFALQNKIDYYRDEKRFIDFGRSVTYVKGVGLVKRRVNFAALSLSGTVLLPVLKSDEEAMLQEVDYFKELVSKYNDGEDTDVLELMRDYAERTSGIIRQRLREEDFLSVVESYLMPDSDIDVDYSVLGSITGVSLTENSVSKEKIYKLDMNLTGARLQLFINKRDLVGLPAPGMRFMGVCRLTGNIKYDG